MSPGGTSFGGPMWWTERTTAGLGLFRTALGVTMWAAPAQMPRLLGVDRQTAERIAWLPRMLAARELALGLGCLAARRTGASHRWLAAQAVSDAGDVVALSLALARGHVPRLAGIAVAAAALAGAAAETSGWRATRPRG